MRVENDRLPTVVGPAGGPRTVMAAPDALEPSSRRRERVLGAVGLTLADVTCWVVALMAALALRYEFDLVGIAVHSPGWLLLTAALGQAVFGGVAILVRDSVIGSFDDAVVATRAVMLTGFMMFGLNMLLDPLLVPRSVPLIAMPIALLLAGAVRVVVRTVRVRWLRHAAQRGQRVIVLGSGVEGQHLLRALLANPDQGYLPVALLDDDPRLRRRRVAGLAVQGGRDDLAVTAARFDADLLLVAGASPEDAELPALVSAAAEAGLEVMLLPPLFEVLRPPPDSTVDGARRPAVPAVRVRRVSSKRAVDVVLCLLVLPLVLPVLAVIALVLVVAQGEAFYRAERVGRYGRTFTMLKLVTMRPGDSGPRVTRDGDQRITPIGRWLRATKLNELPQIFNVLRGDMGIVGPRPEDPRYAAHYSPEQRQVLKIRPGMTSLAYLEFGDEQLFIERAKPVDIEAYYVRDLLPQKLGIELQYLRSCTIRGDLAIIARTFGRMLLRG